MSLGTGALKVGRGPEHFRARQGGMHDVVWSAWIHQDLQKTAANNWSGMID